ncbi:MAG TPA: hypothetical protein VFM98_01765 [Ramlibacter sp.]|uniref:terminase small subunit-like protein n=1 Tax=Ramlibacter sp. TaxID=1917967 RepID=UPI002D7F9662|nr:hypothetical protein [Ramlibacter sp.]HET8744302.1 hypothetical protein [Ramlibacter sp.]
MSMENDERALIVLAAMEDGFSLRQACEAAGVSKGAFLGWCDTDADLAAHYARARERMLDLHAEELEEIGRRAAEAKSAVEVAGLRLQSDNRKWLLSKLVPKKYGDKLALGGAEDLPPVQASLDVAKLPTHVLTEIMRAKDAADGG